MLLNQISNKDTIVSNAYGSSFSILLNEFAKSYNGFNFVITEDSQQAYKIYKELQYLAKDSKIEILYFPDLEILAYDRFSTSIDRISARQRVLYKLTQNPQNTILVASISTILRKLPPISFITEHSFVLKVGDTLDITKQKTQLIESGYALVNNVFDKGEFSVRGSIIDIYPIGAKMAFRIDLFDDEVDSIKELDLESQRSGTEVMQIDLMPSHEFIYTKQNTDLALQQLEEFCSTKALNSIVARYIDGSEYFSGVEFYLPLFYTKLVSIFNYLPNSSKIHLFGNIDNSIDASNDEIRQRYNELRLDTDRPILHYDKLYFAQDDIYTVLEKFRL